MISEKQLALRFKHEYEELCRLPKGGPISWKLLNVPGEPYRHYEVTYRVTTKVMKNGTLCDQYETTVRMDLSADFSKPPTVTVIRGRIPFHPNWYESGRICSGTLWGHAYNDARLPAIRLWQYMNRVGRILAFDPSVTNPDSPANPRAADDWKIKMNRRHKPYPCGITEFPCPIH